MRLNHIIKPTHRCNLNCRYCFNEDERNPTMNSSTLERVIDQSFQFCVNYSRKGLSAAVDFIWHGGEPMLMGFDFYRKVVDLQEKYNEGVEYTNSIQTNGTLIDEGWAKFFSNKEFNVSISVDGPKSINDSCRVTHAGGGTFDLVMEKINILKSFNVPVGVCAVLSKKTKGNEILLYNFFTENQLPFELIPITYFGNAVKNHDELNLTSDELADIWIKIFDQWYVENDEKRSYCMDFVYRMASLVGGISVDCIGCKNCSENNVSTDPNGFVYPCVAFSAMPEWRYGNINNKDLASLMNGSVSNKIKNRELGGECAACKWHKVCYGGCSSRALMFYKTINAKDYYCQSLYKIYEHIDALLKKKEASGPGLNEL